MTSRVLRVGKYGSAYVGVATINELAAWVLLRRDTPCKDKDAEDTPAR